MVVVVLGIVGQEQKKPDGFFVASVAARLSFSRCWKKEKSRRSRGRKKNYIFQYPFVLLLNPPLSSSASLSSISFIVLSEIKDSERKPLSFIAPTVTFPHVCGLMC